MTSEATRKADRDTRRKEEERRVAEKAAVTLKEAEAEAELRGDTELAMLGRTAPLERDEEHSFVQAEESEFSAEELQPDLTKTGVAGLKMEDPTMITLKANDVEYQVPLTESRLETMSDNDIRDAGLLDEEVVRINPAMIAPTSERQRTPYQRSPAAGPGTWPVPEDQLPAVMPSDPPVEEGEDPGDATLSGYPPFKVEGRKVVVYSSEGARSEVAPDETKNAAALYLRLRNQFPHFTEDQLSDEFIIQWESRVGGKQSMRPGQELSQHGETAVGDPRVSFVELGEDRLAMDQAQPRSLPLEPGAASYPEAGLPSVNEPAVRAKDDEKFGLDVEPYQDEVDLRAMALTRAQHEAEKAEEEEEIDEARAEAEKAAKSAPRTSVGIGEQRQMPGMPAPGQLSGAKEAKGSGEKSPASNVKGADVQPEATRPGPAKTEPPKPAAKPDEPKKG